MAKKTNSELFASLLYVIVGVLLMVFKAETINWAMTIAGILFIVSGIFDVLKKNYAGGAVSLIIGIAIIVLGNALKNIVLLVLGVMLAIKGIVAFFGVFKKYRKNALDFLFPALTVVLGLMLAFGNGISWMIFAVGILLTVDGILGLIGSLKK